MKNFLTICCVALILAAAVTPARGGAVEDGLAAAESGDFARARRIWLAEAEKGNAAAQGYLGLLYARGQGGVRDDAAALKWLRLAAAQGDATAQANLGALFARGQGVARDDREAARWFLKAAEQGDARAQSFLGVLSARGQGVKQDDREAAKWFQLAARQGDAKARLSLGVMYEAGRGVTQNPVVACAWYQLAEESGDESARGFRDALLARMNDDEKAMAEQLAEQFRGGAGYPASGPSTLR